MVPILEKKMEMELGSLSKTNAIRMHNIGVMIMKGRK